MCRVFQELHVCIQVCNPLLEGSFFSLFICNIFRIGVLLAVTSFKEGFETACDWTYFSKGLVATGLLRRNESKYSLWWSFVWSSCLSLWLLWTCRNSSTERVITKSGWSWSWSWSPDGVLPRDNSASAYTYALPPESFLCLDLRGVGVKVK